MKHICKAWIIDYSKYSAPVECGRNAKVEENGHWYCGHHSPAARERARQRWIRESDRRLAFRRAMQEVRP